MPVRERNGSYQVDLMLAGRRLRGTYDTKSEAEAFEHEARAAHKSGKPLPEPRKGGMGGTGVSVKDIYDAIVKRRWGHQKSDNGVRDGRLFCDYVGPLTPAPDALTEDQIEGYVEALLEERGVTGRTVNRRLSAVSVLLEEARRLKLADHFPLPWQPDSAARLRYYTDEEMRELIEITRTQIDPDYAMVWRFLADTGARRSEMMRLGWSEIRGNRVVFLNTKNGTNRGIHLTPEALCVRATAVCRGRSLGSASTGCAPSGTCSGAA